MIIRTTFNDNDYRNVLESYWNHFWFKNYYCHLEELYRREDEEGLREWRDKHIEAEDLLEKVFYKESEVTVKELRRFENIIIESITSYILKNYKEDSNYLITNLRVSTVDSIKDLDENGEVAYYLLKNKKLIIM